jgi:hypothetical protein
VFALLGKAINDANEARAESPDEEDEAEDEGDEIESYEDEDDEDGEEYSGSDLPEFGGLQHVFQPYFPAYQNALSVGAPTPARQGVFVFKVSLGKEVWREIALAHDHTLDDLMAAILRSIKFDFDHLYEFTYRDSLGRTVRANHPGCDDGYSADTVDLAVLPLKPGESMELLYDFGDDWRFDVKLERIDPVGSIKKLPKVLESHGKAPRQYPRWE